MSDTPPTSPHNPSVPEPPIEVTIVERPLLAWWAIFPVLILFAVLWFFGWPAAQLKATSKQYAVSYFVGSMLGGLLIPLALAWTVHRLSKRSTLASSITFSAMVAVVCLSQIKPSTPMRFPASVVTSPAATNTLTQFEGFQFEVPSGWVVAKNDYEATRAKLGLLDATRGEWVGLLKVDAGEPVERDVRQVVESFAGKDGKVLAVTIDGLDGLRFDSPNRGFSQPSHGVALLKDGEIFLIMAAGEGDTDITPALEHVLKTWQWDDSPAEASHP